MPAPSHRRVVFSEYVEGTSSNKALEIFNPTGEQADQTSGTARFNGDDAVVLRRGAGVLDSIGQVGVDPGTEWGSGPTSTADNTLRRRAHDRRGPGLRAPLPAGRRGGVGGRGRRGRPSRPTASGSRTYPAARVVVLGDLDDFQFSRTVDILEEAGLHDLIETLPEDDRYSYVFEGNSQALDHVPVSPALATSARYDVVHVNAEFADQVSDHDPDVAYLRLGQCCESPA